MSRPYHDTPNEVPVGRVAMCMPKGKQALAEAYVAIPHVVGVASKVKAKYTKDVLIGKLWAAQCTECDSERKEAEYDAADDAATTPPGRTTARGQSWCRTRAATAAAATA